MSDTPERRVFTADNLPELHFVLGLLLNEGIEASATSEAMSWNWFEVPWEERPSILVRDAAQIERAREIVAAYSRRQADPGDDPASV